MTLEQVREIFQTQLDQNPKDLFYLVYGNGSAEVIRHRLDQKTLDDLATDLAGLEYEPGADATPKFKRTQQ
jgi:hypothetical protein